MSEFASKPLVHTVAGAAEVAVEHHTYRGDLPFDLYRPGARPAPAVIFVVGWDEAAADPSFKDAVFFQSWARMVAARGLVGITYRNREASDVHALIAHLRAHAGELGIDPARLGVWASSGHVPNALAVIATERIAFGALLYGFMLDCADAAAQFRFVAPPVALEDLRAALLVVRAGRDGTPGVLVSLEAFVARVPCTVIEHADGPHAFELVDDSPRTHEVIEEVLDFLVARSRGA